MDKKRIEIIVTAVLVLVLILVGVNSIRTVKQKLNPSAPASAGTAQLQTTASQPPAVAQKKKLVAEALEWARCPFSGKVYSASDKSVTLKLSGILWDEKMPQALVNDEIVKKGDSIGNFIVVNINKNSVVVNDGAKDIELIVGQ